MVLRDCAREKNVALVFDRIGRAAFCRAAFPNPNFESTFGGTAGVAELDFQRKRPAELKHTVETDARLDDDAARADGTANRTKK